MSVVSLFLTAGTTGDDTPLLLEAAHRADELGLAALWLSSGCNPAVAAAAVAVATRRIGLRAAPVRHDPIRVAEEWALVDNLSRGRVGLAFEDLPALETVRRLWRGEAERVFDGEGRPIEIRILPQPLQPELPFWLTDPRAAAGLGAHLLLEDPDRGRLAAYRAAGGRGQVTVAASLAEIERWEADEIAIRTDLAGAGAVLAALEDRHGR
jgi:alkanesulfonate monooxygenase SsuD/methylene tetrahydromethanopterin reductase-like flavin-dependent oxidoreductase (luciferase family)